MTSRLLSSFVVCFMVVWNEGEWNSNGSNVPEGHPIRLISGFFAVSASWDAGKYLFTRSQKRLFQRGCHGFDPILLCFSQVLAFPKVLGQVIELRAGGITGLMMGVLIFGGARTGGDEFPVPIPQAHWTALFDQLSPASHVRSQKGGQYILAVHGGGWSWLAGQSGKTGGEIDLAYEGGTHARLHIRGPANNERYPGAPSNLSIRLHAK